MAYNLEKHQFDQADYWVLYVWCPTRKKWDYDCTAFNPDEYREMKATQRFFEREGRLTQISTGNKNGLISNLLKENRL